MQKRFENQGCAQLRDNVQSIASAWVAALGCMAAILMAASPAAADPAPGPGGLPVGGGDVASCQLSGSTAPLRAGQQQSLAFTGFDAMGMVVSRTAGTATFNADTAGRPNLPGALNFSTTDSWQRSVAVSFLSAGDWPVTATAGAVQCSSVVHVVNDGASTLVLTGVPASAAAGAQIAVNVQAFDQYDNPAIDYVGSVSFSTSAQEAGPLHQAFLPADHGSRSFVLQFSAAGTGRTLTVADDADSALSATATLSVGAGPFGQFLLADVGVPARENFSRNVGITAVDEFGNVIADFAGTAHFASSDGAATLPADVAFTASENGETVVDHGLTFRSPGTQTLTVGEASGAGIQTTQTFDVASAPPACGGLSGSGWNGTSVTLQWCDFASGADLYSVLEDGNILADLLPGFSYSAPGLAQNNTYVFSVTAERQQGVRGTCGAFQSCLVWSYQPIATSQWSFAAGPPPAVALSVSGLPSQMQTGTPATVTVKAVDATGQVVAAYTGRIHFAASDSAAILPSDTTLAAGDSGVKTFPVSFVSPGSGASLTVSDVADPTITGSETGIDVTGPVLPVDPAVVAPPVDLHVATALADSTAFLYSGANPSQVGVSPGTIDIRRAAVVRGFVLDADGNGLGGVTVSILNRPELGSTLSRADGGYDLAVNGGATLTLDFTRAGYLSGQRQATAGWQDMAVVQPFRMLPLESQVSIVDVGDTSMGHFIHGPTQTDARGARAVRVYLPPGVGASLAMPDGSTQSLPSSVLHFRVTEYTVGSGGPDRMPAALPPTSRYTFAVSLTADEEIAAGAKNLVFSEPVYGYVENFLGFPVGTVIPAGHYDHQQANWVAHENGVVIQIVGIAGGQAQLDANGAALGLSNDELSLLAANYSVGQTLWRVPMDHFSDEDWNLPPAPPPGSQTPGTPNPDRVEPVACSKDIHGSIIECENQTLGERTAIAGTPYTLNYRSDRQWGRVANRRIGLQLSSMGSYALPDDATHTQYPITQYASITVAGNGTRFTDGGIFEWNGLDAYNRRVQGSVPITVSICNSGYPGSSYGMVASSVIRAFAEARAAGTVSVSGFAVGGTPLYELCSHPWKGTIGGFDVQPLGLGGWTISAHHAYDPVAGVIYKGDGTRQDAHDFNQPRVQAMYRGDPPGQILVEGAKAPAGTGVGAVGHIAVAPDGTLYFRTAFQVWKISPDGTLHRVAGGGRGAPITNGMSALDIGQIEIIALAAGLNGEVYMMMRPNGGLGGQIFKVDAAGILTFVVGTGELGFSPDGTPAAQARVNFNSSINEPPGLAVHPDTGLVYFSDKANNRVRKVTADGLLVTVAGGGPLGFADNQFGGDGGNAVAATLESPGPIAFGPAPDRTLYFLDTCNRAVRAVGVSGVITSLSSGSHTCSQSLEQIPKGLVATDDGQVLFFSTGSGDFNARRWIWRAPHRRAKCCQRR